MPRALFSESYKAMLAVVVAMRKQSGVTQAQVADRLGRPQSFMSKIERGERRLDIAEFCDLAEAMGMKPDEMLQRVIAARQKQKR